MHWMGLWTKDYVEILKKLTANFQYFPPFYTPIIARANDISFLVANAHDQCYCACALTTKNRKLTVVNYGKDRCSDII